MEIQLLEKKDSEMSFIVKDINPAVANYLRRSMLAEVPVLAIDEVNFIKNDSALFDEIISHRLALIPLKTDLKSYELQEECTCKGKGCPKCTLNLTLVAKGPCTAYSSELKSQDPKVMPVYDKMPITILVKGQKLELEAVARLGLGKEHAKFVPGIVYYRSVISSKSEKTKEIEFRDTDEFKLESKSDFVFTIESFGQLTPKEIFEWGIKRFNAKLDNFEKLLKKAK